MAKARSIASIKAEIEAQNKALKAARSREASRVGMIALEAGFEDVNASEKELREAFAEAFARFRGAGGANGSMPNADHRGEGTPADPSGDAR